MFGTPTRPTTVASATPASIQSQSLSANASGAPLNATSTVVDPDALPAFLNDYVRLDISPQTESFQGIKRFLGEKVER
jgi:hypothetical protein